MSDTDYTTKSRKFHHLTEIQRGKIQARVKLKVPKVQIAIKVGISRSTLYNYIEKRLIKVKDIDLAQKV